MKRSFFLTLFLSASVWAQVVTLPNSDGLTFRNGVNSNFAFLNANKAGLSACPANQYAIQTAIGGVVCAGLTSLQITTALGFTPASLASPAFTGTVTIGSPTAVSGGAAAGSINAQALYVNGVAVGSGGAGAALTSGAGDPLASCTAPVTSLSMYFDTTAKALWYCSATNTWKKLIDTANVGPFTIHGNAGAWSDGSLPVTTAAGQFDCIFESTDKTLECRNDAQVIFKVGTVSETGLSLTDITTADASTSKHGLMRKLSGNQAEAFRGDGTFVSVPDPTLPSVVVMSDNFPPGTLSSQQLGQLGWTSLCTGQAFVSGPVSGHWGGIATPTAASANSGCGIVLGGGSTATTPNLATEINWAAYYKFKTPATLTNTMLSIGFGKSVGSIGIPDATGNDIVLLYANDGGSACNGSSFLHGSDTTWVYQTFGANVNTSTRVTGPAIAASTWYWLRIRNTGTPGTILFSVKAEGGTFPADVSLAANVPVFSLGPHFRVASCDTTAKTLTVAEFKLVQTGVN